MRVVVGEDSVLLREGIARLLAEGGLDVAGTAGDLDGLKTLVARELPDVAIVDIRMPPTHSDEGVRAATWIRETYGSSVGVLVLSQYVEPRFALRLIDEAQGGLGYLLKERIAEVEDFVGAVRQVGRGGSVVDPAVVRQLLGRSAPQGISELTPRELDVLELMAEGRSNAAICARLAIGTKTLEAHVATIFSKLGLEPAADDNRRVLAVLAFLRSGAGDR